MPVIAVTAILLACLSAFVAAHGWAYWHYRAAKADIERMRFADARGHLKKVLRVWPSRADVWFLDGRTARRAEQFDDAESILNRVQDMVGGHVNDELTLEWALLRAQQGDADSILPYIRTLVEAQHPDSALILEAGTRGYFRAYRFNDAAFLVGLWLERQPDNTMALFLQGVVREQIGPRNEATDNYRRILQLDAAHDEARLRLVNLLMELAQFDEALVVVQYLIERHPDEQTTQLAFAKCQFGVGQRDQAQQTLDAMLKNYPENVGALTLRGTIAVDADQLDLAEELLRKAMKLGPSDYDACYQLYQVMRLMRNDAEAKKVQERLHQIDQDLRRLRAIFAEEFAVRSKDPELFLEVGDILLRAGDRQRAFRWLRDGLRLEPEHRGLHAKMAEYYRITGDERTAASHARQASAPTTKQ